MDEINQKWDKTHKLVLEWFVTDGNQHVLWQFEGDTEEKILFEFTHWLINSKDVDLLAQYIKNIDVQEEFPLDDDDIRDIAKDMASTFQKFLKIKNIDI